MIHNDYIYLVFCLTFLITFSINWYLTDDDYSITLTKSTIISSSSFIYGIISVYSLYRFNKLYEELKEKKREIEQEIRSKTLINRPLLAKKVD